MSTGNEILTKKCSACKEQKPFEDFYKAKKSSDGLKCQCKKCHNITTIISRDPTKHSDYNREWMRKSKYGTRQDVIERDMLRTRVKSKSIEVKARNLANRAVELGFLIRPKECPECNSDRLTVHAHHEDYSKPLDVIWLCSECHGKRHRKPRCINYDYPPTAAPQARNIQPAPKAQEMTDC